jgi:hypothetical protein
LILENCKERVYRGYELIKNHFLGRVKLLAGETDSLRIQIFDPENNFLEKMKELDDFIDFSLLLGSWIKKAIQKQLDHEFFHNILVEGASTHSALAL